MRYIIYLIPPPSTNMYVKATHTYSVMSPVFIIPLQKLASRSQLASGALKTSKLVSNTKPTKIPKDKYLHVYEEEDRIKHRFDMGTVTK